MERRRRKDIDLVYLGGRIPATNPSLDGSYRHLPPTALEQAYQFLETGSLNDTNYYQTRWRFYENGDNE